MKSPICEVCLRSEILCSACQGKVDSGELKERDVHVLGLIYKETERNKSLSDIQIKKIIDGQDLVLVVCNQGSGRKIVGKGGFFAKKLEQAAGKPVRVVEESSDVRSFLQNIILPVPIINLNILYTSSGDKYKIIIPQRSRLPMPLKTFQSIAMDVTGKNVEIGFEDAGLKKV